MAEQVITIGVNATVADSGSMQFDAVVNGDQVQAPIRAVGAFDATIIDPEPIQPPTVAAGTSPATNQPYVPEGYQPTGYTFSGTFNPSILDRLEIPQEPRRVLSIPCTFINIGGISFNDNFFSGDWASFYDDASQGQIVLKYLGSGRILNPRASINRSLFRPGTRVEWRQQWAAGVKIVCFAFITDIPTYSTGGPNGVPTLSIPIGDKFIRANRDRLERTEPYCGVLPTTLGQAARIYWSLNAGETLGFPQGGPLPIVLSQFLDTPPYEFISQLYRGVGMFVHTSPAGNILFAEFPEFDENDVLELDAADALELTYSNEGVQPFSRAIGTNEFTTVTNPSTNFYTYEQKSNGYDTEIALGNMDPWWLGGPTLTRHSVWELGNEEIRRVSQKFGFAPVGGTLAIDAEESEENRCAPPNPGFVPPGTFPGQEVEFRLVQTETQAKTVVRHSSGAYLVTRDVTSIEGEEWFQSKDGTQWIRYDGQISATVTEYTNLPLFSPKTCERDYEIIIQQRVTSNFGLIDQNAAGDGRLFVLLDGEDEEWVQTASRQQANAGQFSTAAGEWRFTLNRLILDQVRGGYEYPQEETGVGRPPQAIWIDRPATDIRLETTQLTIPAIESEYGKLVSNPVRSDYSFTVQDLRKATRIWLRLQAGLHEAIVLQTSYALPLSRGKSIRYTDRDGVVFEGLVWSFQDSQTGNIARRSVLCIRKFDI